MKRSSFPGPFHDHRRSSGLNRIQKVVTSAKYKNRDEESISTYYLISLALISKTTHENIGFEKLKFINP